MAAVPAVVDGASAPGPRADVLLLALSLSAPPLARPEPGPVSGERRAMASPRYEIHHGRRLPSVIAA